MLGKRLSRPVRCADCPHIACIAAGPVASLTALQRGQRAMAGMSRDTRTGVHIVQFYDADRRPQRRRVSTGVREIRPAERLRRFWEAEYAEGRYDPWNDAPPAPGTPDRRRAQRATVTLADARARFLASRAHLTVNTVANHERVSRWFATHAGVSRALASVTSLDIESWLATLTIKPVTRANYVQHLRTFASPRSSSRRIRRRRSGWSACRGTLRRRSGWRGSSGSPPTPRHTAATAL